MSNIQHGEQTMPTALYFLGPTQDCLSRFKGKLVKPSVIPTCFTVFAQGLL
jgi:hypothetical protein